MSDKHEKPVYSTEKKHEGRPHCVACGSEELRTEVLELKIPVTQGKAIAYDQTRTICLGCNRQWTSPNFQV